MSIMPKMNSFVAIRMKDGPRAFSVGKRPVLRCTDSLRRFLCLATKVASGDTHQAT
jgi:hypothetical protein